MSKNKINTAWFQKQIKLAGLTQRQVSRSMNMDPGSFSQRLNGTFTFRADEAAQLAQILKLPMDDVLINMGIQPPESSSGSLAIKGWVDGELMVHMEPPKGPRTAPKPAFGRDVDVLRFQTVGSALDGMDGALVYYQSQDDVNHDHLGKLCVVDITKKKRGLRVVKRGYQSGSYHLYSMSGEMMEEDVSLEAISPVVWLKF